MDQLWHKLTDLGCDLTDQILFRNQIIIPFVNMATYGVYTYQFSPLFNNTPSLFEEDNIEPESVWRDKQRHLGDLFNENLTFKYRNATYNHEVLYNENNLIVLKLANNKHIVQESRFITKKLQHNPSCKILIDNRKDVQNIYIEDNKYSFSETGVVCRILEKTFNSYLKSVGLSISIRQRFNESEFWTIIRSAEKGIDMVRFYFQYPNLPRVQESIDAVLSKTSKSLRSKKTCIEYNAGEGETLLLEKNNQLLSNLVQSSASSGSKIIIKANGFKKMKTVGESVEMVEIENLEASLSSDLLSSASQKLIDIINRFKV